MAKINAKEIFKDSILELMQKKSLNNISVFNIVDNSGLSRQSFYVHYKDKYDLINQIFDADIAQAVNLIKSDAVFMDVKIEAMLDSMHNNLRFYVKALEYTGQNSLIRHIRDTAYYNHSENLMPKVQNEIPMQKITYCLNYHANCITIALVEWMKDGAVIPSHDIVSIVTECMPHLMKTNYIFKNM